MCARLGHDDEAVTRTDLDGLAAGAFAPLAVVLLEVPGALDASGGPTLAWGLPDDRYAHRAGMVTKAEVRAVALGKLALPGTGVLWDVGAGSGSVAVECSRLAPGLRVFAVERRADDVERLRQNAVGTGVVVVEGEAPDVLGGLPARRAATVLHAIRTRTAASVARSRRPGGPACRGRRPAPPLS